MAKTAKSPSRQSWEGDLYYNLHWLCAKIDAEFPRISGCPGRRECDLFGANRVPAFPKILGMRFIQLIERVMRNVKNVTLPPSQSFGNARLPAFPRSHGKAAILGRRLCIKFNSLDANRLPAFPPSQKVREGELNE